MLNDLGALVIPFTVRPLACLLKKVVSPAATALLAASPGSPGRASGADRGIMVVEAALGGRRRCLWPTSGSETTILAHFICLCQYRKPQGHYV